MRGLGLRGLVGCKSKGLEFRFAVLVVYLQFIGSRCCAFRAVLFVSCSGVFVDSYTLVLPVCFLRDPSHKASQSKTALG